MRDSLVFYRTLLGISNWLWSTWVYTGSTSHTACFLLYSIRRLFV